MSVPFTMLIYLHLNRIANYNHEIFKFFRLKKHYSAAILKDADSENFVEDRQKTMVAEASEKELSSHQTKNLHHTPRPLLIVWVN